MRKLGTYSLLCISIAVALLAFIMLASTTLAWFVDTVELPGNKIEAGRLDIDLLHKSPDHVDADEYGLVSLSKMMRESKSYHVFDYRYWEPGYVEYDTLYLRNEGNLHFKYKLCITPMGDLTELADMIDVYSVHSATIPEITERDEIYDTSKMVYAGTLADIINERDGVIHHGTSTELGMGTVPPQIGMFYQIGIAFKMNEKAGNDYQDMQLCEGQLGFNIGLYATQWRAEKDSFNHEYDKEAQLP